MNFTNCSSKSTIIDPEILFNNKFFDVLKEFLMFKNPRAKSRSFYRKSTYCGWLFCFLNSISQLNPPCLHCWHTQFPEKLRCNFRECCYLAFLPCSLASQLGLLMSNYKEKRHQELSAALASHYDMSEKDFKLFT